MEEGLMTKRWWKFFVLFFVVWYPISVILVTAYQVTASAYAFMAINLFAPLWFLIAAYLYFKNARNDWQARFFTAFGWVILMFFLAALLVKPVYGYSWTTIVNLDVLLANWINVIAVIVAGMVAHKPKQEV